MVQIIHPDNLKCYHLNPFVEFNSIIRKESTLKPTIEKEYLQEKSYYQENNSIFFIIKLP